ncbi:hypothetical protein Y882_06975 [Dyella japonica DSM 16301]|uniref:Uncharacterized protein n=1 Tax=Dyella japonica DSM 16301 TaxID=1440762 RepID=A0A0G9H9W5_9GAMM|nr:hypothetical protein Y882_06975 [Dyella japonica DSM 16301]
MERFRRHIGRLLLDGRYDITDNGVIIGGEIKAAGTYFHRVRQRELAFQADGNRVVSQGLLKILGIALYNDAKLPAFYLALCSGNTPITDDLAASNFAATMNEITSQTEGYTSATRPQWVPSAPAAGVIGNLANKASYQIETAASVTITGAGLLSDNGRGSTAGVLVSASLFANPRTVFDGETFDLGYQVSLTD